MGPEFTRRFLGIWDFFIAVLLLFGYRLYKLRKFPWPDLI